MLATTHPEYQLAEIRERHAHLRRQAERAHHYRQSGRRHVFRTRQRRR